jgi:hypothetical protein
LSRADEQMSKGFSPWRLNELRTSGAKARVFSERSAQLKSCPDTTQHGFGRFSFLGKLSGIAPRRSAPLRGNGGH